MLLACSLLNALELTCRLWKRCGLQILGVRTTLVWAVFQNIPPCANSLVPRLGPGHGLESSMQSGSSSRRGRNRASSSSSGRNRGAAVEADVIGRRAAAEAAQSESSSWTRGGGKRGAAVEADAAIGPGSSS